MPLLAAPQLIKPIVQDPADRIIDGITHLPAAPAIAAELLRQFKNENQNVNRIVELIRHDPALTVEVLKRCNSAYFGGEKPVSDMFQAVTRVGFYEIYCMVMSTLALQTLELAKARGNKQIGALWRHSVISAVAAETLAAHSGDDEATAFTAGLLHDVGKLMFISAEPAVYKQIADETGLCGSVFLKMERSLLGVTHADVGARLLQRWNLPANIAAAVLHHHGPPAGAGSAGRLAATIKVADTLAHQIAPSSPDHPGADSESMKIINLTPEKLSRVSLWMGKGLKRVEGLLQMVHD